MASQPTSPHYQAFKASISPTDGNTYETAYWVPNEIAVTVRTPTAPTLEQLQNVTARLRRLLSEVGISVIPFYAGGQRLSRAASKPDFTRDQAVDEQKYVSVEIVVGRTRTKTWVEVELEERWQAEQNRRPNRLPGVHMFGSGPTGAAVVFYTLITHRRAAGQKRDSVQIAVDRINQNLDLRNPGAQSLRVLAAMPNWLTYASPMAGTPTSGPGAPPLWSPDATPPSGSWLFKQPKFATLMQQHASGQPAGHAKVILLDTSPGLAKDIIARAQSLPDYAQNSLLGQLVNDLQTGKMLITDPYAAILLDDHFIGGQDDLGRPFGYNMNDHGLFIAGIIRSIAPQAEIKLVRTQNPYGAGDLGVFLDALEEVEQRHDTQEIVLNLSMGTLPLLEELHDIWFGGGCCCEAPPFADAMRTLEKLHLALRLAIRSLIDKGVVIVAAAGNDSLGKNPPHGPRFPARYDGVLGVAAVNRLGKAAAYSNQANVDHWGSGIATYGGEEPNDDSDTLAWYLGTSPYQPGPPDAVHSLYLNPTYPPLNADDPGNGGTNSSGWAWWSGTSFATGVGSGLAAHHVMAGLHGQQVIQAILNGLASAPYSDRLQAPILEVVEE